VELKKRKALKEGAKNQAYFDKISFFRQNFQAESGKKI